MTLLRHLLDRGCSRAEAVRTPLWYVAAVVCHPRDAKGAPAVDRPPYDPAAALERHYARQGLPAHLIPRYVRKAMGHA